MTFRKYKNRFMLYPEDKFRNMWDTVSVVAILISCVTTPLDIVFLETYNPALRYTIDIIYLIDLLLVFNSAYYDAHFDLIQSRK